MSGEGRPQASVPQAGELRLGIAAIRWHAKITDRLLERAQIGRAHV